MAPMHARLFYYYETVARKKKGSYLVRSIDPCVADLVYARVAEFCTRLAPLPSYFVHIHPTRDS